MAGRKKNNNISNLEVRVVHMLKNKRWCSGLYIENKAEWVLNLMAHKQTRTYIGFAQCIKVPRK